MPLAYLLKEHSQLIIELGANPSRLNSGLTFIVSGVQTYTLGDAVNNSIVPVRNLNSGVAWLDRAETFTGPVTFTQSVSGVDGTQLGHFATIRQVQSSSNSGLVTRVTVLENNQSGIQNTVSASQTKLVVLESNQSGLQNQINQVAQGSNTALVSNFSGLSNTVSASQTQITILGSNQSGIQNQIVGIQAKDVILANNQSGLTTTVGSTQARVTVLESNFSGVQTQVNAVQTKTSVISSNQSGIQTEVNTTQSKTTILESNFSGLQTSLGNYALRLVAGQYRIKANGEVQLWNPTQLGFQSITLSGVSGGEMLFFGAAEP